MGEFAGIDLGKEVLNFHVVDAKGATVRRGRAPATPQAARQALNGLDLERVGVEAGPYGAWLVEGLRGAGVPGVLIETRRMKQFRDYSKVKTDARDAEQIAQAMRCELYTPVHVKSTASRQARTLLRARTTLSRARLELQNSARGLLKEYGVKLKRQSSRLLEDAIGEALVELDKAVSIAVLPLVAGIAELRRQEAVLSREVRRLARTDAACRLLMTVPGVGPIVGLAFRATLDNPQRFADSQLVGAYLGLTPAKYASGETDYDGEITRQGDKLMRAYLYEAATVILGRLRRPCALRDWGLELVERRGRRRATVALARKLAVVMHRVWLSRQPFDWERRAPTKPSA
jgi:transposase